MTEPKTPIKFFSSEMPRLHDDKRFRLTASELKGVSAAEISLLETMVDVYRGGTIMGIEDYSNGCSYPEGRRKELLEQYKIRPLKNDLSYTGPEGFLFSMYGDSFGSDAFISKHKIRRDTPKSDGLKEIAKYLVEKAAVVPNSKAFCDASENGTRFGFILTEKAASAMRKINIAMNPRVRGSGD